MALCRNYTLYTYVCPSTNCGDHEREASRAAAVAVGRNARDREHLGCEYFCDIGHLATRIKLQKRTKQELTQLRATPHVDIDSGARAPYTMLTRKRAWPACRGTHTGRYAPATLAVRVGAANTRAVCAPAPAHKPRSIASIVRRRFIRAAGETPRSAGVTVGPLKSAEVTPGSAQRSRLATRDSVVHPPNPHPHIAPLVGPSAYPLPGSPHARVSRDPALTYEVVLTCCSRYRRSVTRHASTRPPAPRPRPPAPPLLEPPDRGGGSAVGLGSSLLLPPPPRSPLGVLLRGGDEAAADGAAPGARGGDACCCCVRCCCCCCCCCAFADFFRASATF